MKNLLIRAGGCAVASAFVLSPMTIVAAALLGLIVKATCRGISGDERRLLLWILVAAITLRVAAVGLLFFSSDPATISSFPFDGDGAFLKLRSLWILNVWQGVAIDQSQFQTAFLLYGWTSYAYVLAYLQYFLGPAPYAVHLLSVCWTIAAAGLLYRLVRKPFGPKAAFGTLLLILFLPTLFLWSISAMREAWLLFLTVLALVGMERAISGRQWSVRIAWGSAVIAGALVLETTRVGGFVLIVGAMVVAIVGRMVASARLAHPVAVSVVVLSFVCAMGLAMPSVQARAMAQIQTSAELHIGHVRTEGYSYTLLDQRFYSGDSIQSMTLTEGGRYLTRALVSFVLRPFPWEAVSLSQIFFIPQQLLWYALLPFAVVGALRGCQRNDVVPWLFLGVLGVGAVVIAPHEGNLGTLVRHRDGLVPFVACLSSIGITSMASSGRKRLFDVFASSAVIGRAHAVLRIVLPTNAAADLLAVWRGSALAVALGDLRHEEQWLWCRRLGAALLGGATLALVLAPNGGHPGPSLFVLGVTVVCSLVLVAYPHELAVAFSDRRAWTSRGT